MLRGSTRSRCDEICSGAGMPRAAVCAGRSNTGVQQRVQPATRASSSGCSQPQRLQKRRNRRAAVVDSYAAVLARARGCGTCGEVSGRAVGARAGAPPVVLAGECGLGGASVSGCISMVLSACAVCSAGAPYISPPPCSLPCSEDLLPLLPQGESCAACASIQGVACCPAHASTGAPRTGYLAALHCDTARNPPVQMGRCLPELRCACTAQAKRALKRVGLPDSKVTVIELDTRGDGSAIQSYLGQLTGGTSVPRWVQQQEGAGAWQAGGSQPAGSAQRAVVLAGGAAAVVAWQCCVLL